MPPAWERSVGKGAWSSSALSLPIQVDFLWRNTLFPNLLNGISGEVNLEQDKITIRKAVSRQCKTFFFSKFSSSLSLQVIVRFGVGS